jgi:predicted transcriptional regulator
MSDIKLFDAEYRFMNVIWGAEPVNSTVLVKMCAEKLGWKKGTTYTVLRKLCERGIARNENATVSSIVKREQLQKFESETLLNKSFNGSLPMFLAAFLDGKKISQEEAGELKKMIEEAAR